MASKILSGTAAAVKKFFRADAGALAVAIPVFAAAVMAVVVSQTATDWPVVYGHFEWSVFGDSLAALALFWAALRFCSGWCAALAAVLAYAALVLRIFMLVLYRETYMSTDYSSIKLLWDHTDFYAIGAMLGRYCWLWLIPATLAALAVVGATAYAAWRRIGDLAPGRLRVWKRIAGALFLAAVAGNVLFLLAEAEGRVYTGHLARPLPVSAAYFVRDALGGGRRSPAVPLAAESRAILEAKGVIPPAGSPPAPARPARFDRIVIVAVESLDLAFIRAFNPGMPEGVTPNLDRLMTQYPSMTNFFCSSQPTSWGLTGLLMSRFDFDRELLEPEKRPSLFRVASKQGYVSCYFSPMVGIFAENRRTYGELFAPDRQFYLEDWHRKYGLWRDFAWGISDRELYSCVLNELRALKKQRFVALVSTMDTHHPYTADGITGEEERRFPTPFLRALHMADRHLGNFLREFMADPELYDDRTLIVITADHTATHGENYLGRADLSPERVPLIFVSKDPAVFAGLDRNKYASGIDLAPTLVEFVGGEVPKSFMGRSLFSSKNMAVSWLPSGLLLVRAPGLDLAVRADAEEFDPEQRAVVDFYRSHYGVTPRNRRPLALIPGFLLLLLFLSAFPFWGAVCRSFRPERLFAAGLFLNGLLFYFFCGAGLCAAGFYSLLAANLALYVPAALTLRRDPGAFRRFATPGVKVFYVFLAAGFLLALYERPLLWDEFSHWCTSARFLFKYGTLNCAQGELLKHASYPPGLPVLDTLVHRCFVGMPFRDYMPRFAIRAALLTLAVLPLGDMRRGSFRECLAGLLFYWFAAEELLSGGIWSCESDCILGCLFAAAVYVVMRHDRSVRDDLLLALLLAWLVLVKKAGTGFAVMTLVLYVVRWIADRKSGETPKRPVWSFLVVLGAPFLIQASWSLLLKLHHTPIIFPVGKITPRGIWRLVVYGEPAGSGAIARGFAECFVRELPFVVVAALLLVVCLRVGDERLRRPGDLCWFLPLALAGFCATLLVTYLFIFSDFEARKLASCDRYLHGFLIMPLIVPTMLLVSGLRENRLRRVVLSWGAAGLLLIRIALIYHAANFCGNHVTRQWPEECAAIDAGYGNVLRAPGERFVVVSSRGAGIYQFIFNGEYERNFAGEVNLPPPDPERPAEEPAPDDLKAFFRARKADHVLFMRPRKDLAEKYAGVWETPPDLSGEFALFAVAPDGRLRPVRRGDAAPGDKR